MQIPLDVPLFMFIFLSTITGYNFVKYAGIARFKHRNLPGNLQLIQVFSFLCFLALVYFATKIKVEVLLFALLLGCLNLLYAVPLFKRKNLRAIGGIKVFIIALIWTGATVLLPVIDYGSSSGNLPFLVVQRFFFVLVLLIPFEIRDLQYDPPELRTIPQRIGQRGSRVLGLVLLIIIALVNTFKQGLTTEMLIVDMIIYLTTAFLVWNAKERQGPYHSTFLVEGIPILWVALCWIFL